MILTKDKEIKGLKKSVDVNVIEIDILKNEVSK